MPVSSDAQTPRQTSAQSPDTLPLVYSVDQLKNYIMRQLGYPVWIVELTPQQVLDHINDALIKYGTYVPRIGGFGLQMVRGQFKYLEDVDVQQGIAQIDFVEPNPVPTEIFYGNLIQPAPLFRTGLDEYDTFLRWRKTWTRVTSVRPDWYYDDMEHALYIHNPLERYLAGVQLYGYYTTTESLSAQGRMWVREYSLASARYQYGDLLMKYSGAIPSPSKDVQLDQGKRDKAEAKMKELEEQLKGMQTLTPITID